MTRRILGVMDSTNLPTNQEDREVYLHERGIGHFIEAVKEAKAEPPLVMLFDTFEDEPEALYVALKYARDENVRSQLCRQRTFEFAVASRTAACATRRWSGTPSAAWTSLASSPGRQLDPVYRALVSGSLGGRVVVCGRRVQQQSRL